MHIPGFVGWHPSSAESMCLSCTCNAFVHTATQSTTTDTVLHVSLVVLFAFHWLCTGPKPCSVHKEWPFVVCQKHFFSQGMFRQQMSKLFFAKLGMKLLCLWLLCGRGTFSLVKPWPSSLCVSTSHRALAAGIVAVLMVWSLCRDVCSPPM